MTRKKELCARELLEAVYENLKKDGKEIKLPSKVMAEIANDSDWHRTRVGYTSYDAATVLKVGRKKWAIALGIACGNYPADYYNCDIAAVQVFSKANLDEKVAIEVHNALEKNSYFRESLIFAVADGTLMTRSSSRFGQKVIELLGPRAHDFIAKHLEVYPDKFRMNLLPVVKSPVLYKPEFVDFLYEMFLTVLKQS